MASKCREERRTAWTQTAKVEQWDSYLYGIVYSVGSFIQLFLQIFDLFCHLLHRWLCWISWRSSEDQQQRVSKRIGLCLLCTETHGEIVAVNADRTIESVSLFHVHHSLTMCVSHCASRTGGAPVRIVVVNLVLCVRLIRLNHVFPRCRSSNPKRH